MQFTQELFFYLFFFSSTTEYLMIQPRSIPKSRLILVLCFSPLATKSAIRLASFCLKTCAECHGRSLGTYLELERKLVVFLL